MSNNSFTYDAGGRCTGAREGAKHVVTAGHARPLMIALLLSLSWLMLPCASTAAVATEGASAVPELWTQRYAHHGYCGPHVQEFCPDANDASTGACLRAHRDDLSPECTAALIRLGVLSAPPTRSPMPAVL